MADFEIGNGILHKYYGNESNVVIPNSVTKIGAYVFSCCTNLTSIEIPNSVTNIGNAAFRGCTNLTNIKIPNSVTRIGDYAFAYCTNLTSINLPNSVISIGHNAFLKCNSLKNIEIPNSVTCIGNCAFQDCISLTNINIPNSVTDIGHYAFFACENLTSVNIPNSVKFIGDSAFYIIPQVTTHYKAHGKLRAFKAFNSDWTCRGFQYVVGKSYHQQGIIKCCYNGFHACPNPLDVFNYYYGDLNDRRFAEVELSGRMNREGDKVAASDIRIVRELTVSKLVEIYKTMEKK